MIVRSILPILLLLALAPSCKTELLLDCTNIYGVREILRSSNCVAACGQTALCEGDSTRAYGQFVEASWQQEIGRFRIADFEKMQFELEVVLDTAIRDDLDDKLARLQGQPIIVKGILGGYDAVTNYACDHQFTLSVQDTAWIQGE